MLKHSTRNTHLQREHFSQPISEPGGNLFGLLLSINMQVMEYTHNFEPPNLTSQICAANGKGGRSCLCSDGAKRSPGSDCQDIIIT